MNKLKTLTYSIMISISFAASAENSYIRDMSESSNSADQWEANQHRRAMSEREQGNTQKAYEISEYAEKRTERVKTLQGGTDENGRWSYPNQ